MFVSSDSFSFNHKFYSCVDKKSMSSREKKGKKPAKKNSKKDSKGSKRSNGNKTPKKPKTPRSPKRPKTPKTPRSNTQSPASSNPTSPRSAKIKAPKSKQKASYQLIKEQIFQRLDLSRGLEDITDDELWNYAKSDHRTLLFHCIDKTYPRGTAEVIYEIIARIRNDKQLDKEYGGLNGGASLQLLQTYLDRGLSVLRQKLNFTPLMNALRGLRKNNDVKNESIHNSIQNVLILIVSGVNVDSLALVEPEAGNLNARDYQEIHPIALAYTLYIPDVFMALCFHSKRYLYYQSILARAKS